VHHLVSCQVALHPAVIAPSRFISNTTGGTWEAHHQAHTCSCSPPHLQLGDFGLSKVLGRGAGRDAAACVAGTLPFLAPELLVPGATTSFAADVSCIGSTMVVNKAQC
jgi:serine/threonine protein kinase